MSSVIRGTYRLAPRLSVPAIPCDHSVLSNTPTAIAKLSLNDFSPHVLVPVQKKLKSTTLQQEVAPNWDRILVIDHRLGLPAFSTPVLLSSRNRWHLNGHTVEVFDRAVVIDGAKRLEAAFHFRSPKDIPVVIVFGLKCDDELALRHQIHSANPTTQIETHDRFGTMAPRLSIDTVYIDFEIQSDPFVVPTSRGYAPAILVRRPNTPNAEHVLIGARSLATELEAIRSNYGSLVGLHVSARKMGPEKISPYVLRVTEQNGDQSS